MALYALGDMHLSFSVDKPMDIFGDNWVDHWGSIRQDWLDTVSEDDLVISAGDISWAMDYAHAKADLDAVCAMPGSKILIRGNHDYWHSSLKKTNALIFYKIMRLRWGDMSLSEHVGGSRKEKPIFLQRIAKFMPERLIVWNYP